MNSLLGYERSLTGVSVRQCVFVCVLCGEDLLRGGSLGPKIWYGEL